MVAACLFAEIGFIIHAPLHYYLLVITYAVLRIITKDDGGARWL